MPTTAFAPGSVTTVFVPQDGGSSLGVSFATADGVTATVESAPETAVFLADRPIRIAPVTGVLDRLEATATVRLEMDVPLGYGFGASGAATLATALAANEELALGHPRDALVEGSHRAEVAAGTGLGDVFIQDRGGLVWDMGNGIEHMDRAARIEYTAFRDITTAELLGDEDAMERVTEAGREALEAVDPQGPIAGLFGASWRFAERTGLPTERTTEAIERVWEAGGAATMAMIGETVVATDVDGVLEHETHITPNGAALQ